MALLWFSLGVVLLVAVGFALKAFHVARKPRGSDDLSDKPDRGPTADRLGKTR